MNEIKKKRQTNPKSKLNFWSFYGYLIGINILTILFSIRKSIYKNAIEYRS